MTSIQFDSQQQYHPNNLFYQGTLDLKNTKDLNSFSGFPARRLGHCGSRQALDDPLHAPLGGLPLTTVRVTSSKPRIIIKAGIETAAAPAAPESIPISCGHELDKLSRKGIYQPR